MAGLLTNGTYVLVPEQEPDYEKLYDYAMFDDNGNPVAGVKHDSNMHAEYIGAFKGCQATELRIYDDKAANASGMFSGCSALRSIPDNSFNSVITGTNMFFNCISLTAIPSNSFNSVTIGNSVFASASSLTSIGENCLTNLTSGGYSLFANCSSLPELPDNFLNKVSGNPQYMFQRCFSLTAIPKNSFNNMSGMNGTFNSCSGLVDISNLTSCFAKATSANLAFASCKSVTSELIPIIDYFRTKTPPLSAGSAHMFSACKSAADYATCTASPVYSGWVK